MKKMMFLVKGFLELDHNHWKRCQSFDLERRAIEEAKFVVVNASEAISMASTSEVFMVVYFRSIYESFTSEAYGKPRNNYSLLLFRVADREACF
jgi:hypothetical protein